MKIDYFQFDDLQQTCFYCFCLSLSHSLPVALLLLARRSSRWDGGDSSIYSAHKSVQGIPNENEVMRYPPSSSTQHLRRETSRGSALSSRQSLFFPNRSRAANAGTSTSVISVSEYGTDTEEEIQVKERVEDGFGGFVDKAEGGQKRRAMTFPSSVWSLLSLLSPGNEWSFQYSFECYYYFLPA